MLKIAQESNEVTNMNVKDLKWYVYYHSMNSQEIKTFNIFNHGGFRDDVEKYLKKYKDKEEFTEKLKGSLMYYFWSKCEWEVVITPWVGNRNTKDIKIDVYDQVMNNWDIFVDYVYNSKIRRPRKNTQKKNQKRIKKQNGEEYG